MIKSRVNKKLDSYDLSETMLYGCFEILEDYVEIDKAILLSYTDSEYKHMKPKSNFLGNFGWFLEEFGPEGWFDPGVSFQRRPSMGIIRLNIESNVKLDNGKDSKQAKLAKEILNLYYWWQDRKYRESSFEKSTQEDMIVEFEEIEKEEEKFLKEDQKMLLRLIKIRPELWS